MLVGQKVKVIADEWSLFGKIGKVLDRVDFNGATRWKVEVDGEVVILTQDEVDILA